eukprot:403334877
MKMHDLKKRKIGQNQAIPTSQEKEILSYLHSQVRMQQNLIDGTGNRILSETDVAHNQQDWFEQGDDKNDDQEAVNQKHQDEQDKKEQIETTSIPSNPAGPQLSEDEYSKLENLMREFESSLETIVSKIQIFITDDKLFGQFKEDDYQIIYYLNAIFQSQQALLKKHRAIVDSAKQKPFQKDIFNSQANIKWIMVQDVLNIDYGLLYSQKREMQKSDPGILDLDFDDFILLDEQYQPINQLQKSRELPSKIDPDEQIKLQNQQFEDRIFQIVKKAVSEALTEIKEDFKQLNTRVTALEAQLLYASRQFDLQISDFMTHEILLQAYLLMMPNLVKPDKGELGIFNKISESNWEADLEGLPPHEDVHVRLCLPQKSKTINNALEEQNSKKKARKIAHFKRPSPTKLFIAGDFVPYSVQLTEGLQLDTNNGIEEKVRQKKEDERQRIIEEKRKQDEELRIQQEAQTELMRQLDAIKGKQFTFDQKGNVILQDFVNFNHLPNPLLNIKHIGESETLKINNKFEKSIKLELKAPLKNQTIKEMLNQIPIVISKPQPIPAGSFFEVMNPGIGVKIKEGKITKEQDEPYEKYYGKTSRAAYMLKQEKDGLFQSSMKEQAQLKSNNGSIKDQSSPKRHSQIFTERLSEIGEVDQSSIALDMKKSKGRIYFKKPQALNDLINTTINQQQCFKLITIMNNTKQLTLKNQSIKNQRLDNPLIYIIVDKDLPKVPIDNQEQHLKIHKDF